MRTDSGTLYERLRWVLDNPALRTRYLPEMKPDEHAAINRMLPSILDDATAWCQQGKGLNPETVLPLVLVMCVLSPNFSREDTLLAVKANLWVFALDDLLDDPDVDARSATATALECRDVALSPTVCQSLKTDLGFLLQEIKSELFTHPLSREFSNAWSGSLIRLVDGMMCEFWRTRRTSQGCSHLPSIEEYLFFARNSIGLPYIWMTCLVQSNDASAVPLVPSLLDLADECGTVMRLSNDLRSLESELHHGKINAVHILGQTVPQGSIDLDQGQQAVRQLIGDRLQVLDRKARAMHTESGLELRYSRATEFGLALYDKSDFRTLSSEIEG